MKNLPLTFLILLTSCKSFLLTGSEAFSEMYVRDSNGCAFTKAAVVSQKLSRIGVRAISFYLHTEHNQISIPKMEMDMDRNHYTGIGTDGKMYTVKFLSLGKITTIRIAGGGKLITVSNDNICIKRITVKKTDW